MNNLIQDLKSTVRDFVAQIEREIRYWQTEPHHCDCHEYDENEGSSIHGCIHTRYINNPGQVTMEVV